MNNALYRSMALDLAQGARHVAAAGGGLLDFVPRVSPQFVRPTHLAPLARLFERAVRGESIRAVVAAPPQHGKTEVMLHGIAWALAQDPTIPFAYATYGADLSHSKSRHARDLARSAGVELSGNAESVKEWLTSAGGGLRATGVGGPLTGHGARIGLVDDPYKNRADAESSAYRHRVEAWFNDVLLTRIAPGGSVIVWATRWTPNDLSGKLVGEGWEYIRLPAIEDASLEAYEAIEKLLRKEVDADRAADLRVELARAEAGLRLLWPERWEGRRSELLALRKNAYTWASLYQGSPRPRGGTVFKDVYRYDPEELPRYGYREAMGIDAAYTRTTSSDSSAYNVQRRFGDRLYVVESFRGKLPVPDFMRRVGGVQKARGGIPCRWYTSTIESGVADLAAGYGASVEAVRASQDKFLRGQPMAGAWNDGRVLVPSSGEPWVDVFLNSMLDFTGIGDEVDDEVDAAVAAYDVLVPEFVLQPANPVRSPTPPVVSDRRWADSGGRGW